METSRKVKSWVISILLHAALLLCFYYITLDLHNPPLQDPPGIGGGGGGMMDLGEFMAGTGNPENNQPTSNDVPEETVPEEEKAPEETPLEETQETVTPSEDPEDVTITATEQKKETKPEKKTETKTESTQKTKDNKQTKTENTKFPFPGDDKKSGPDNKTPGKNGSKDGKEGGTGKYPYPGEGDGQGGGKGSGKGKGTGVGFGDGYGKWKFVGDPYPNDKSTEEGKVEFAVTIDENGKIIYAKAKNFGGVSPKVIDIYIKHLKTLSVSAPDDVEMEEGTIIPVWYTINAK